LLGNFGSNEEQEVEHMLIYDGKIKIISGS